MNKKHAVIPAKDANESQRAYRERIQKEQEEKQRRADFNRFVTEKKEDFTLTVLGAIPQHTRTDKTKIAENVGIAAAYADELLSRIYGIRKAPTEVPDEGKKKEEPAPAEQPEAVKEELPNGTV